MLKELVKKAKKAKENAYAPYSKFKVGAVLTLKDGTNYLGCNIENAGIMSICAERVAFLKAISEGKRDFSSILIIADKEKTTPCGYCRQFMREFVPLDFKIYIASENTEEIEEYTLEELLPHSYQL